MFRFNFNELGFVVRVSLVCCCFFIFFVKTNSILFYFEYHGAPFEGHLPAFSFQLNDFTNTVKNQVWQVKKFLLGFHLLDYRLNYNVFFFTYVKLTNELFFLKGRIKVKYFCCQIYCFILFQSIVRNCFFFLWKKL